MKEINIYRLALVQYYLSYIFPKRLFETDSGFCKHFYRTLRIEAFEEKLPVLYSLRPQESVYYWFERGDLKPRIELLKQAIKLCKEE